MLADERIIYSIASSLSECGWANNPIRMAKDHRYIQVVHPDVGVILMFFSDVLLDRDGFGSFRLTIPTSFDSSGIFLSQGSAHRVFQFISRAFNVDDAMVDELDLYLRQLTRQQNGQHDECPIKSFVHSLGPRRKVASKQKNAPTPDLDLDSSQPAEGQEQPLSRDYQAASSSLDDIIGMSEVKSKFNEIVKKQSLLHSIGRSVENSSPRLVFAGAPGTGKTTIAARLAANLFSFGVIRSPQIKAVSGAELKAQFIGHTSKLVNELFDEIEENGQLLLIDEIYSLFTGELRQINDFAGDAIGVLLARMERLKNGSALILAGYPDKLHDFFAANQGLISRTTDFIYFPNYSVDECFEILTTKLKEAGLTRENSQSQTETADLAQGLKQLIASLAKEETFANGRTMRNLAEHIFRRLAVRLDGRRVGEGELLISLSDFSGFRESASLLLELARKTGGLDSSKPVLGFAPDGVGGIAGEHF